MEIRELDHKQVLSILPDRKVDAHKGDFGKILLLCGSLGYTGAAALSAMGALRSGAGLVYLGVPECIYAIEAVKLNEAIVFPLPDEDGKLSDDALFKICKMLPDMDAVLFGPGWGKSEANFLVAKAILESFDKPVVVDADGINVLAGHMDIVRERKAPTIFTPHPGEFARIGGNIEAVRLLGQGISPLEAAAGGAWLHGAAGDVCAKQIGQYGMLPTDMVEALPRLMK